MNIFKLGTRWGKGNPDFYDLIKELSISLSHKNDCSPQKGDVILIAKGFKVFAITILKENTHPVINRSDLELLFGRYQIDFDELTTFADSQWLELNETDRFDYQTQDGICQVQKPEIITLTKQLLKKYMDAEALNEIIKVLEYKKQIILQGPPGTGKTKLAKEIAKKLISINSSRILTREDIVRLCSDQTTITTAKTSLNFKILGISEKGVRVENSEGTEHSAPFNEIVKMFQNKAWEKEGVITNGTDSYSAAIAKFIDSRQHTFLSKNDSEYCKIIQFHPSYSYEDFVRGIVAESKGEKIEYNSINKILGHFAEQALRNHNLSNADNSGASIDSWVAQNFEEFKNEIEVGLQETELKLSANITIFEVADKSFKYGKNWKNPSHLNFSQLKGLIKAIVSGEYQLSDLQIDKTRFAHAFYRETYYKPLLELFFKNHNYTNKPISVVPRNYVLLIDEINRADLSSALGELIYALEYRGEAVESMYEVDGEKQLILPPNLYIIGTMNTADRSVGHINYAIRRRFAFVDILPEPLKEDDEIYFNTDGFEKVARLFNDNNVSSEFDSKDVQIGHSYFIIKKRGAISQVERDNMFKLKMNYEVIPILNEYVKDGILVGKIDGKDVRQYINELKSAL
ncbi:AAA family ATPase [Chitinophaga sp. 212800010-3]|uniref:AAA family ATPase n=1 Tax=unclassified Chitinophaga TaxID=2619133 RepID=UPI002DF607B0|nr:hypothetical protein [Chitinophaga sp. 212800010-3]